MKKMKGLVTALLLLVLIVSVSAQGAQKPLEITFWSLFTGGDGEFFDAMVKEFNASQNEIIMRTDTVKFDDYYTKLTAALAAKTAPDVVVMHQDRLSTFVPSGVLLPLDAYVQKAGIDLATFEQTPLNNCKIDNKLYAIPLDVHPLIMYCNLDLFAKAGITKLPESLSELFSAAETI